MRFQTYTVGRDGSADLCVDHPRVSRRQVEITVTAVGRYYVVDCGSRGGTHLWRDGAWTEFTQGYVQPEEKLAFGDLEFELREIIERLPRRTPSDASGGDVVSVRPRRKRGTGEVERVQGSHGD
jgi:pSer/pThr/pTyr-binding forkhead associated (FHA) protein